MVETDDNMKKYLCYDIGGTEIKSGIYDERGNVFKRLPPIKTKKALEDNKLVDNIVTNIESVLKNDNVEGIAISTAGVVNPKTGQVVYAGKTISNYGTPKLKEIIETKFNLPCAVENDVNSAILGEVWKGQLKDVDDAFMLTLGTGIGGAIILNGELVRGSHFSAGEIGYMKIEGNNFQSLAAASVLERKVSNLKNEKLDGLEIFKLAKNNDKEVLEIIDETMYYLSLGLLNINYMFNPDVIVIGGGIINEFALLKPFIDKHITEHRESSYFTQSKIVPATLKNNAGMIGALYSLLKTINKI